MIAQRIRPTGWLSRCKTWLSATPPGLKLATTILTGVGLSSWVTLPAVAAERVFINYPPFQQSVLVSDLEAFVEDGTQSPNIRLFLNFTDADPEVVQEALTRELSIDLRFVDNALYQLPGEYALFQLGNIIHTPSRRANIQALRGAMILSVSDDNRISLLEFLQMYPLDDVYIDARELSNVQNDVSDFIEDLEPVIATVEDFLADLVCDCAVEPASASESAESAEDL